MPETLDPFLFVIDSAFDAADEGVDFDDEPATTLLEHLESSGRQAAAPIGRPSGRLVSLLAERG